MYSRIAGTGKYLPQKILTNFDLEKMVAMGAHPLVPFLARMQIERMRRG